MAGKYKYIKIMSFKMHDHVFIYSYSSTNFYNYSKKNLMKRGDKRPFIYIRIQTTPSKITKTQIKT